MTAPRGLIALDGDGVLLDYHAAYRTAWGVAFGQEPALRDVQAYWPIDRWDVPKLESDQLERFRAAMRHEFWSSMPALPGAVQACKDLRAAGYELVCVSAVDPEYEAARLLNLRDCGIDVMRVVATPSDSGVTSPKAKALRELKPVAFVDDYAPYLRGLPSEIHAALLLREPNGSPNVWPDLELAHSTHTDLADFAQWWLQRS